MAEIIKEPVCLHCKHLLYYPYCKAFLDGIPDKVRLAKNNHRKPIQGDNGIRYEAVKEKSPN